jgi:hypothetical protein
LLSETFGVTLDLRHGRVVVVEKRRMTRESRKLWLLKKSDDLTPSDISRVTTIMPPSSLWQ